MTIRTTREAVVFAHAFELKGADWVLPPGDYPVVTDEELMDWASFPVYRRISTMIFVPTDHSSSTEMVQIDPADLQTTYERDSQAKSPGRTSMPGDGLALDSTYCAGATSSRLVIRHRILSSVYGR